MNANFQKYLDFLKQHQYSNEDEFFQHLTELFPVSSATAYDIWYAYQRSWFEPEMIDALIKLDGISDNSVFRPNLFSGDFDWDDEKKEFVPENGNRAAKSAPNSNK